MIFTISYWITKISTTFKCWQILAYREKIDNNGHSTHSSVMCSLLTPSLGMNGPKGLIFRGILGTITTNLGLFDIFQERKRPLTLLCPSIKTIWTMLSTNLSTVWITKMSPTHFTVSLFVTYSTNRSPSITRLHIPNTESEDKWTLFTISSQASL